MQKLTRDDLLSLEQYAEERPAFRDNVMAHKKNRRLDLGTNAALYFEDRLTMQYQVQLESDLHDRISGGRRASGNAATTHWH